MQLHPYQEAAIDFMYERDFGLVLASMGAGKTAITLHWAHEMLSSKEMTRLLVVAPKKVCEEVWRQETEKFDLPLRVVFCNGKPEDRHKIVEGKDFDILLINYEQLVWFCRAYPKQRIFDGIVFDELTKLKAPSTSRFKLMRHAIGSFKFRWGLTGTLASEGVDKMYAQLFMIDQGKRLGRTKSEFDNRFMTRWGREAWQIKPMPDAQDRISSRIADISFTLNGEYKPPPIMENTYYVDLPAGVREMYDELEREMVVEMDEGGYVVTPNVAALRTKLRQIATGQLYTSDTEPTPLHKIKEEWLRENRDQMDGNILIGYWFRFEPLGATIKDPDIIDRWNDKKVEELWVQPASAGHGLNLQKGGHTIVWKTLPDSRDMYDQTIGRIARQGQEADTVWVHVLIARDTVEEDVWNALNRKQDVDRAIMQGVVRRQKGWIENE
jgi:SNF2 family DNA or RNA helicase